MVMMNEPFIFIEGAPMFFGKAFKLGTSNIANLKLN